MLMFFRIAGVVLILIGITVFFFPEIAKLLESQKENPLFLLTIKKNGFWIGTSPILILILLVVYLILRSTKIL
jgi:uncharacterized membrane protein HdeD (DUF308 family)